MPERAIQKLPEIPSQQALIVWRDGVETLVIASELDSQAQSLGWIIPLPSLPTSIEKADVGGLNTLQFCLQPKITHDLSRATIGTIIIVGVAVLIVWTVVFWDRSLAAVLVVLFLLFVLAGLLLPALGSAGSRSMMNGGIQVQKTAHVGAYDINILQAAKPGDLNDWLTANQFTSLPSSGDAAAAQYIRDKWVFATIKLRREEAGRNTPHPLKMQFASPYAVYPMKLTALAGAAPQFDLFIVGDKRVRLANLPVTFCDRFYKQDRVHYLGRHTETAPCFAAEASDLKIGHPDVCSLLWDGCVLTRVTGKLTPHQMSDDLRVEWETFRPSRLHFFSPVGAREIASMAAVIALGLYLIFSATPYKWHSTADVCFHGYVEKYSIRAMLVPLVMAASVYLTLPKLPASQIHTYREGIARVEHLILPYAIDAVFGEKPDLQHSNESVIATAVIDSMANSRFPTNLLTGSAYEMQSTPGNFTVRKEAGRVVFELYDEIGSPMRFEPTY